MIAAQGFASPLFDDHTPLEITLTGPVHAVIAGKREREEFHFRITLTGGGPLELKVRVRGNSRLRVCDFPPLRLDFSGQAVENTLFQGQKRLKLVTHCNDRSRDAGNVIDEYLAYRIFNAVSPFSYRTRLLRIGYIDTDGTGDAAQSRWGFLIESNEDLASRMGATVAEIAGVPYSRVDHEQAALMYVFEYLIGNTDWSLVTSLNDDHCCHNVDIFEAGGQYVVVPYDFDLAGLVDASYAKPDPSVPIRSVRTRRYRGYCLPRDVLTAALHRIKALQAEVIALADAGPADHDHDTSWRSSYLREFFERAADEVRLISDFERRCL